MEASQHTFAAIFRTGQGPRSVAAVSSTSIDLRQASLLQDLISPDTARAVEPPARHLRACSPTRLQ